MCIICDSIVFASTGLREVKMTKALKFDPEDDDRDEGEIEETDETLFGDGGR